MAKKVAKKATKKAAKKTIKKASRPRKKAAAARGAAGAAAPVIQSWPTDPMGGPPPLQSSAPTLPGRALPTAIIAPATAPAPMIYATGTADFRYWTAAEALRRAADFWTVFAGNSWNAAIAGALPVRLDDGVDLNAYYARDDFPAQDVKRGLSFFHDTVQDVQTGASVTVFSGESPDVVAHELGHGVLDALKPALWGVTTTEAAAFHESFGDMSAILVALQLPSVRQAIIQETGGRIWRNSSVSRVAEQLGYAIRQRSPTAVDPDCLRNASNTFVYTDPTSLPTTGPASSLTRRPHNFSRIFTGAFLEALGGMVLATSTSPSAADLLTVSQDMGRLLARAVVDAPVRIQFFQAVAEQLVLADSALFNGRYAEALTAAFVRRGLLSVRSLAAPAATAALNVAGAAAAAARSAATAAGMLRPVAEPVRVALDGASLGLPFPTVYCLGPAVDDSTTAGPIAGVAERSTTTRYSATQSFVEDLVVRGRVAMGPQLTRAAALTNVLANKRVTHRLVQVDDGVQLERLNFDCGC